MKLFDERLPFYRANLHTHTTCSDGRRTPAEAMALYREAGYDILAITDHRRVTATENVPEGLLMLPGIELDFTLPGMAVHILGLGMSEEIAEVWDAKGTPQQAIDAVRACGGEAVLAHPAWSLNTPDFIASLQHVCATEIWNSVSTLPYNGDRADSSSLLDVTGASTGRLLPVFASDDTHFYGAEFARGATMIQAETLTVPAVMEAIRAGRFYATCGPEIRQITVENGTVHVECSAAEAVVFYSALPWSSHRCCLGSGLTQAEYTILPGDHFIRVQVVDAQGRSAWASPFQV